MKVRVPPPSSRDPAGAFHNARAAAASAIRPVLSRWTFLTNHAQVLVLLSTNPSIVLREVAARVGITERAIQRIIHELEQDGFIIREKVGRQNNYQVARDKNLRHPVEAHCTVQQLLDLVADARQPSPARP